VKQAESWLSTIVRTGRWYFLSSVSTKVLALGTITVLTRHLPPSEFGALNAVLALTLALPMFLSLYLDSALARLYHDHHNDRAQLSVLFSTVFWFVIAWGVLVLLAFVPLTWAVSGQIAGVPTAYIWIATIPVLLAQLSQLGLVYLRQSFDARAISTIEIWSALTGLILTYLLVALLGQGVMGRLIAMAVSALLVFAYVVWFFAKTGLLGLQFDLGVLRKSLAYSLPLLPNLVAGWIAGNSDRLFIAKYVDLHAVGLYSLAATIASLLYVVQDAVTQVTGVKTQVGLSLERQKTLHMIRELSIVMWVAMLFVDYCALAFSVQVVHMFTGAGYQGAAGLIGACGFIYVISPQNRILQDIIAFNKKTWIISTGAMIMAAVSLALNFWLMPRFGYIVAPYVFIVATLAQTAWLYGWVHAFEQLPLHWWKAGLSLLVFLAFVALDQWLAQAAGGGLHLKVLITICYAALTWRLLMPNFRVLKGDRASTAVQGAGE
jgi:O-antigen/teichoic acid export membrane protein